MATAPSVSLGPFESLLSPEEQDLEDAHFEEILYNLSRYEFYAQRRLLRMEHEYGLLLPFHQSLLPHYPRKLVAMKQAVSHNQQFLQAIIELHQDPDDSSLEEKTTTHETALEEAPQTKTKLENGHESSFVSCHNATAHSHSSAHSHVPTAESEGGDRDKHSKLELSIDHVRSTLRQFVRDWSIEVRLAQAERTTTYAPILKALEEHFSTFDMSSRHGLRVLVPGSGLGRLPYEIAKRGFSCQGNEFSLYMLLSSELILNHSQQAEEFTLFPYVLQTSNLADPRDSLRPIRIPDECPAQCLSLQSVEFSMVAGDFLAVYRDQSENWDAIVTCFFIDTANNVITYMERIYQLLKKGGIWINLGPLLYHFENSLDEHSIELSLIEVKQIAVRLGFQLRAESFLETTYAQNQKSMLQTVYRSAFFVAQK